MLCVQNLKYLLIHTTLSRWSRLHLQLLTPTSSIWAGVVGYGPFSLCVIHKEGLWLSRGTLNRLMMMTYYGRSIAREELDGPAVSALRCAIAEVKQRWSAIGWVTKN
jgi:hypothetical protein